MGKDMKVYTTQSGYMALLEEDVNIHFEGCGEVWDLNIHGSGKVFGWQVLMDRIPSRVNLARRGINIQCNLCPLCMKEEETIQYLLMYCEVSQRVWDKCDRWVGLTSLRNNDIVNHF